MNAPVKLTETIPPDILDILGAPPLLATEEPAHYHAMMAQLVDAIRPKDMIAWMLIRDLLDQRFEIARYRRMKADVMRHVDRKIFDEQVARLRARHHGELQALRAEAEERAGMSGAQTARADTDARLAARIRKRAAQHRKAIGYLQQSRCTEELAGRFDNWAPRHDRLDALLDAAERRFRTTLGDLERHLDGFARALRGNLDRIIDVGPAGGLIADAQSSFADTRAE